MLRLIVFLFLFGSAGAQTLPKHDNGVSVSYNYSQRKIQDFPYSQKPIIYPNLHFKKNFNFKNDVSFKTGASVFITGHKYEEPADLYYGYNYTPNPSKELYVCGYLSIPALISYNMKNFYADAGVSPCLRLFRTIPSVKGDFRGMGATVTCEGHFGYYIPVKQRRLFIETAIYISEIGTGILLPAGNYGAYYNNDYTCNLQLSVGFMFNKATQNQ